MTSTYLTNADFEGDYSVYASPTSDRDIHQPSGWTISYTNGNENDLTSMNSECRQWSNFSSRQQPTNGGNNTYWIRYRWASSATITLSQIETLPAGTYRLSADAFAIGSNATATISAAGKSVTVDTRNTWANYGLVFTLTESTSVTFALTYKQTATAECILGVDNFKLVDITQGTSDITAQNWTSMIANAGFERGLSGTTPYGYTMSNSLSGYQDLKIVTDDKNEGDQAYNLWAATVTSANMYQDVTLPAGKYTISADIKSDNTSGSHGVYAKIGDDTFKSSGLTSAGEWETLSNDFYVTETGTVRLGASSAAWFKIDNFQLSYKGALQNTINSITPATATAITNDKWYAVNISTDGDYRIISSVNNTVTYTQDGYKIPSDISTSVNLTAGDKQVLSLTSGTLYVLAANDATLTVEPDVYSYIVGDGTPSVADNGYTQSNTMTITFSSASTNDPDGEFTIRDASKIKVNGTAASASLVGNTLTITLASTLATYTDYAVSVEAGAVGYNADNTNAAISLTAKTPAAFDGFYFLRTTAGKYVARGGDYNTRAIVDEFGLPLSVATNASGITQFTFVDNGGKLFLNGEGNAYTDNNTTPDWTLSATDGGYYIVHADEGSYKDKKLTVWNSDNKSLFAGNDGSVFVIEPASDHNTQMDALKDAQAAAAAEAIGNDAITTKSALASWLGSNFTTTPIGVPAVVFTEKWNGNASAEWGAGKDMYTNTITDLPAGLYKLTVNAYYRINGSATAADGARANVYLYGGTAKTQLYSIHDFPAAEAWSGNNQSDAYGYYPDDVTSGAAATASSYLTDLYVYHTGGDFAYGIHQPSRFSNSQWFGYQNFTLTRYDYSITVGPASFATYVCDADLDFTSAASIEAYTVKVNTKGVATLTQVDEVPAGTPVLLYADGGATEGIPVMTGAGAVGDNDLVAGTGATVATDGGEYTNMILNDGEDGIGFYFAAGQTVAKNRAYLHIANSLAPAAASRMVMVFADETTGISTVKEAGFMVDGYYDLQGRRVTQPAKGLYIVNGKKVVIK